MIKEIAFDDQAREHLRQGVVKLARAVKSTLGPKGRQVVIGRGSGSPRITKDGVTVAEEIHLANQFENAAAQLLKQAAQQTNLNAGDGTTTSIVLAEAIYLEGLKYVVGGAKAVALRRGLRKAVDAVLDRLRTMGQVVEGRPQIEMVATISANHDRVVGAIIAEAVEKVGREGVIATEVSRGSKLELQVVPGMQFDRGFATPQFVNQAVRQECVLESPLILIHEEKILQSPRLVPVMEIARRSGRPLLIIADNVEGEALSSLVLNKTRGILACCAVRAPGYGDQRRPLLEDLGVVTGATVLFRESPLSLEQPDPRWLGTAKRVVVTASNTLIMDGGGTPEAIRQRADQLRDLVSREEAQRRLLAQERLAHLVSGVAKIQVGAYTEAEARELKARVDDALHATRAAVTEGVLPGGGTALLRASQVLDSLKLPGDEAVAINILKQALRAPLMQLAANAGEDGSAVVQQVLEQHDLGWGWDVNTGRYGDLLAAGVQDPVKVVRCALENAASVATLLLNSDCIIIEKPQPSTTSPNGL